MAAAIKIFNRQMSRKIAKKLPPPRQYFRLDNCWPSRNNLPYLHTTTTQKGEIYAQPAFG